MDHPAGGAAVARSLATRLILRFNPPAADDAATLGGASVAPM